MVKKPIYKIGDVLLCTYWDQGDGKWEEGITLITEFEPASPDNYTTRGIYGLEKLSGDFNCTAMAVTVLETEAYPRYIGNIYENEALRILYGK